MIPLVWKGGVEKKFLKTTKYESMYYLAIWERLRGENLNINLDSEQSVASAATAIMIIVMPNIEKLSIFYRYNVCQI